MIKALVKITFIGLIGYLIIRYPGTVADLAAGAITTVRDVAATMFVQIGA